MFAVTGVVSQDINLARSVYPAMELNGGLSSPPWRYSDDIYPHALCRRRNGASFNTQEKLLLIKTKADDFVL